MKRRKNTSILPDLIFSKFFLVFCVFLFLVVLLGLAKGTVKSYKVNSEVENLQVEIDSLERQNQDLGQLINYLKSDTFIEQEAKLKMGYKKPGENLIIIPQNEFDVELESEITETKNISNLNKWWNYFFGKE